MEAFSVLKKIKIQMLSLVVRIKQN